ncbi:ABC-type multidrug transport system, ATPase component [Xenococcus sp. PCC 7305]|uniref:ABC transporter ATP-binding protein n=1 Tax=Xenococcus sp. PCC 7305 TaxID=102125 RepID=UPI0002AC8CBF|nr:ABC transporter ATP-binding protein [Xenococcus sp. PCC 7305]ELS02222.1 ABC-type multidrug transport system, ATPase component [Xenococcus sp. PCC 7305]
MYSTADLPTEPIYNEPIPVVQTWNLCKVYRTGFWMNKKIESLKDCSLTIYQGETFGLLGPNGAGKTTLLKILLDITKPTSGKGIVLDKQIGDRRVKQRIGYLPENAYYYEYLTAWEFLEFTAGLFQIPRAVQKKRIIELLNLVGLAQSTAKKKKLKQYSKGMLQRVGMAQALINDPEIVFLDEPMSGLDPMGRYRIREIILSLKQQGKTIFFNSHILADVEQICDRVAVLALGDLICQGSLDELLGTSNSYHVTIKGGDSEQLTPWLTNLTWEHNRWHGQLQKEPAEFISYLKNIDAQLVRMNLDRLTLEAFFMQQLRERGIDFSR